MKTKHVILAVIGGIGLCGFGAFVLILAFLMTLAEHVEREEAGKLTIAVRHKMIYYGGEIPPWTQCVQPEIGLCRNPVSWNRETHRAVGAQCRIKGIDPQPFLRHPEISDWEEYEFELEPGETYYWYVFFENHDNCFGCLPADLERFETGEIKLTQKEAKRIERNFTK